MKTARIIAISLLCILPMLAGCSLVSADAGHQAVLVEKPYLFGHGGIASEPVATGTTLVALSTDAIDVNMQPVQYELKANDFMSSDGIPLDFDAVVRLQVTDSVALIKGFGPNWYTVNVEREFSNLLRQEVRKHTMNETAISTDKIDDIDQQVGKGLADYLKLHNLPVILADGGVTVGRAMPPDAIKHQRIDTAQQEQRVLTEAQRKLAEDAREQAEASRAKADNAYRNAMDLSPDQFLKLENIKMEDHICTQGGSHCTVILNGSNSTPILDTRK